MFKDVFRGLFFNIVGSFGVCKLFAPYYSGIGCILMFHRVIEGGGALNMERDAEVTTGFLEAVIRYFDAKGYDVVSLDQVYNILTSGSRQGTRFVAFTFDDGYLDTYTLTYPIFKRYDLPFAVYITTSFPDNASEHPERPAMNWEQIKEMSGNKRVIIGAHTVSHRVLSRLPAVEVRHEIGESKRIIESHIGKEVTHFAYPYGSRAAAGRREFEIAKEFGFKTVTTTRCTNLFEEHREHLECLPRFTMEEGDVSYLNVLTSGTKSAFRYGFKRVISA